MPHIAEHHPEKDGHSRKHEDRGKDLVVLRNRIQLGQDVDFEQAGKSRHYGSPLVLSFQGNEVDW